ncbi:Unknown protein [Striga hermonthica]|uniref:Reverse transcriptase RNase H-like domain-containing protein n=1 Tax=Striga hermonthica TaxID=68872 RepID=A0A9N7NC59_STRHE|nr:Unknown protein [Striga hermonthica]
MASTPVLALPDFSQPFIVECDASDAGLGAVLQQQNRPIAYFSRPLAARHVKLPAYEKELVGLAKAIQHWRPYLWGRSFIIRTDHYSLKFLLEQRIITSPQQRWLSKLMGFDFTVEYRAGRENVVADALSRQYENFVVLAAVSTPQLDYLEDIKAAINSSIALQQLRDQILNGELKDYWSFKDGLLIYKG